MRLWINLLGFFGIYNTYTSYSICILENTARNRMRIDFEALVSTISEVEEMDFQRNNTK